MHATEAIKLQRKNLIANCYKKLNYSFHSYMYMMFQPGIASEESYPYHVNGTPGKCEYNQSTTVGSTTGYARLRPGNETLMKDVVAANGPIAISISLEAETFFFYK